jgi:hypothetical protein
MTEVIDILDYRIGILKKTIKLINLQDYVVLKKGEISVDYNKCQKDKLNAGQISLVAAFVALQELKDALTEEGVI